MKGNATSSFSMIQNAPLYIAVIPLDIFQCVKHLMIHDLIGIVSVISKNRNPVLVKMLQDRRRTGGAAALPIFALTDDI